MLSPTTGPTSHEHRSPAHRRASRITARRQAPHRVRARRSRQAGLPSDRRGRWCCTIRPNRHRGLQAVMPITRHHSGRPLYQFDKIIDGERVRFNKLLPAGTTKAQAGEYDRRKTAQLWQVATGGRKPEPLENRRQNLPTSSEGGVMAFSLVGRTRFELVTNGLKARYALPARPALPLCARRMERRNRCFFAWFLPISPNLSKRYAQIGIFGIRE